MVNKNRVSVSNGNTKMGPIPSVSLPAGVTCNPKAPCFPDCYAHRLEAFRSVVHDAYMRNYSLYQHHPRIFWFEVEDAVSKSKWFRFHVSGDIPDADYFKHVVKIAERHPGCQILMFTKQYDFVNRYLKKHEIPENLHVLFSGWKGFKPDNPYNLPEAHVRFRDGTCEAGENAKECGGNCTNCANTGSGCWTLKRGEQLILNQH